MRRNIVADVICHDWHKKQNIRRRCGEMKIPCNFPEVITQKMHMLQPKYVSITEFVVSLEYSDPFYIVKFLHTLNNDLQLKGINSLLIISN